MLAIILIVILISAVITFFRLFKGPTVFDRIAAMDSIGVMFLVILVIFSYYFDRKIFLDIALVYGLLLFVDILIMAKYFGKSEGEMQD